MKLKRGDCVKQGINPKAVYDFVKRCEAEDLGINTFMLIKDGVVVAEGYHSPYTNEGKHVMYSLSKSITAIALGYAVDEGRVSLEDSVCKYFGEYDRRGRNEKITVRHLVTMTAGKMIGMASDRKDRDWIKIFFDAPFFFKPGKHFLYTNDNFYVLSAIISKVYGQTLVDFLYPRLFEPLGIDKPDWEVDKFGYAAGGWGLYLSTEDLSKIMLCYSQYGKWEGKRVIPEEWVRESSAYQVPTNKKGQIDVTKGYGYGFWRLSRENSYRAYGLHGQMGYVFEDKNTVLAMTCGISKDMYMSDAINEMCKTLWDEPDKSYSGKLKELLSSLGDMDDLPKTIRNRKLELDYNQKALMTRSSSFASMLPATMSTVMHHNVGRIDRFILSLDSDNNYYMAWKEGDYVNKVKLGMENRYEATPVNLAGIRMTAYTKAAWTQEKELTVLVRIGETCCVRRLVFDFTNKNHIIIKNDSYPDLPQLAAHYVNFSGIILPKSLERLLEKHIAPAVLLLGEPDFKIK